MLFINSVSTLRAFSLDCQAENMLWKLILAALAFFGRQSQEPEYGPNWRTHREKWEPQTQAEERAAYKALHNTHKGGDMILPPGQLLTNSIAKVAYRWPGYPGSGRVPYVIDSSIETKHRDVILKAIEQYNRLTCVQFTPRRNEKDFVRILKDKKERGCWSYVGKVGGEQKLALDDGCYYVGTIVHELGHAIGFLHEHQRSDRDDYLTVYERNMTRGMGFNVEKSKRSEEIVFNNFDYKSIMIYGNYAFSKKIYELQTIVAKNGMLLTEPFNKPGLDNSDVDRVNMMYKCRK